MKRTWKLKETGARKRTDGNEPKIVASKPPFIISMQATRKSFFPAVPIGQKSLENRNVCTRGVLISRPVSIVLKTGANAGCRSIERLIHSVQSFSNLLLNTVSHRKFLLHNFSLFNFVKSFNLDHSLIDRMNSLFHCLAFNSLNTDFICIVQMICDV